VSSVGKERYGSVERVDGGETVEIAWGELRREGATLKCRAFGTVL